MFWKLSFLLVAPMVASASTPTVYWGVNLDTLDGLTGENNIGSGNGFRTSGNLVAVTTKECGLIYLDRDGGSLVASYRPGGDETLTCSTIPARVEGGMVYGSDQGHVIAVELDGTERFITKVGDGSILRNVEPLITDESLIAVAHNEGDEGRVTLLNVVDGTIVDTKPHSQPIGPISRQTALGFFYYTGATNGDLWEIDLSIPVDVNVLPRSIGVLASPPPSLAFVPRTPPAHNFVANPTQQLFAYARNQQGTSTLYRWEYDPVNEQVVIGEHSNREELGGAIQEMIYWYTQYDNSNGVCWFPDTTFTCLDENFDELFAGAGPTSVNISPISYAGSAKFDDANGNRVGYNLIISHDQEGSASNPIYRARHLMTGEIFWEMDCAVFESEFGLNCGDYTPLEKFDTSGRPVVENSGFGDLGKLVANPVANWVMYSDVEYIEETASPTATPTTAPPGNPTVAPTRTIVAPTTPAPTSSSVASSFIGVYVLLFIVNAVNY